MIGRSTHASDLATTLHFVTSALLACVQLTRSVLFAEPPLIMLKITHLQELQRSAMCAEGFRVSPVSCLRVIQSICVSEAMFGSIIAEPICTVEICFCCIL